MSKIKEPEWEFIFDNEPDEEVVEEFHKSLAQIYINKYGANNMRRVLEVLQQQNS
ncbi:hypothetical protein [uncultured Clostridium sp.]|uniref:hypothetical protein n=1 Tax=uncultured Clostridium sp. TaxID=59620 RepID=UPI0025D178DC|nr:hypothetical protein [uncultured Clostridium sp.]